MEKLLSLISFRNGTPYNLRNGTPYNSKCRLFSFFLFFLFLPSHQPASLPLRVRPPTSATRPAVSRESGLATTRAHRESRSCVAFVGWLGSFLFVGFFAVFSLRFSPRGARLCCNGEGRVFCFCFCLVLPRSSEERFRCDQPDLRLRLRATIHDGRGLSLKPCPEGSTETLVAVALVVVVSSVFLPSYLHPHLGSVDRSIDRRVVARCFLLHPSIHPSIHSVAMA